MHRSYVLPSKYRSVCSCLLLSTTDSSNANAAANANYFKISNAIDANGKPVNLKYIDFIKVQVGVNAKSGWLGEVSTEVFGFFDYSMIQSE